MARDRLYGVAVMAGFALVAGYMACSALLGLAAFVRAVGASAPAVIVYSGDVIVLPGAGVVAIFAYLEIVRPAERSRRRLVALALGCFFLAILLPVCFRLSVGPFLAQRGYILCPGRVVGYTLPATRFARDPRQCRSVAPDGGARAV